MILGSVSLYVPQSTLEGRRNVALRILVSPGSVGLCRLLQTGPLVLSIPKAAACIKTCEEMSLFLRYVMS